FDDGSVLCDRLVRRNDEPDLDVVRLALRLAPDQRACLRRGSALDDWRVAQVELGSCDRGDERTGHRHPGRAGVVPSTGSHLAIPERPTDVCDRGDSVSQEPGERVVEVLADEPLLLGIRPEGTEVETIRAGV